MTTSQRAELCSGGRKRCLRVRSELDYRGAISNPSSGSTTKKSIEVAKKSHGQILGNERFRELQPTGHNGYRMVRGLTGNSTRSYFALIETMLA